MTWDDYLNYNKAVYSAVYNKYPLNRVVTTNGLAGYYQFLGASPVLSLDEVLGEHITGTTHPYFAPANTSIESNPNMRMF